jgi:CO dehydrogenase/acetyl-CoA synthase gamma subunit (corrinoid Fe-S protein)
MLYADLYLDRIELAPYLDPEECRRGGFKDCAALAASLREGNLKPEDCLFLSPQKRYALSLALRAKEIIPPVQSLELPRPVPPDLFTLNDPGPEAPVLVTGNSEFTLTVLTALLATTVSPFFLLLVDCRGDTVDMAMVYRSFTARRLSQGLTAHDLAARVSHRRLLLPGWLAPLQEDLSRGTGWEIQVGPICAAELPLFLREAWQPPPGLAAPG